MAGTTYNLIASQVVGSGGASSITFSSIPQTYTDLKLVFSSRTASGGAADVAVTLNSDGGSNYPYKRLQGSGSSASSGGGTFTAMVAGSSDGSTDTSSSFASSELYIPNYTSSNYKSGSTDAVTETTATTAYATLQAGLWNNTSAITSMSLFNTSGTSFAQYTTAYLYGIKNS